MNSGIEDFGFFKFTLKGAIHLLLPIAMGTTSLLTSAQNTSPNGDADCAAIKLSADTIDFGSITRNSDVMRKITIINSGKCPLIISAIKGGSPREYAYDKTFYQPGDSGHLSVYFVADKEGPVMQSLIIYSNARISKKELVIRGKVSAESRCAVMAFDHDTLDMGALPYVFGQHFYVNVHNTGTCNMTFTVAPTDEEYLNLLSYTRDPVHPGDTGKISIHLGGQLAGNYYGKITVTSSNSNPGVKTLYLKARFVPPAMTDTNDTEILVSQDMFDLGTVQAEGGSSKLHRMTANLMIKNTGKKTLRIVQKTGNFVLQTPRDGKAFMSLLPGGEEKIEISFYYQGEESGDILVHSIVSGNFRGKSMPIYARWKYAK